MEKFDWLEDSSSKETQEWIRIQNEKTNEYMKDKINHRLKDRISELRVSHIKITDLTRIGEWIYFISNQVPDEFPRLYRKSRELWEDDFAYLGIIVDPNAPEMEHWSLLGYEISEDGKYIAVVLTYKGSDERIVRIIDLSKFNGIANKFEEPDDIKMKNSLVHWHDDGFYYNRHKFDKPVNSMHCIWYHKIGTSQTEDKLIYSDKNYPQRYHFSIVKNGQLFMEKSDGGALDIGLYYYDKDQWLPIVESLSRYTVTSVVDGKFIYTSNLDAPNYKVMIFDPLTRINKEFIAEDLPLLTAKAIGNKLFLTYLVDVKSCIKVFDAKTGQYENDVELPGIGTTSLYEGFEDSTEAFFCFESYLIPQSVYVYNLSDRTTKSFYENKIEKIDLSLYETKQEWCINKKDETRIPMFITGLKSSLSKTNVMTILYGYGGFLISETPEFNSEILAFLELGGLFCVANIRGGGEFGEIWHEQGMLHKKQNCFDDFIAAAEFLCQENYTSSGKLVLKGRSNGGLLVGAVINQRPDIAAVAIPQVGVMDMLRFHKFTIGWNWVKEYGSPENPEDRAYLLTYSPLHNIRDIEKYPAILVTTCVSDERVVPCKYAAALQENESSKPKLIKIDVNSGHSEGTKGHTKAVDDITFIYSFILANIV